MTTQTTEHMRTFGAYGASGGLANVAKHGRHGAAAPARAGFMRRFEREAVEADPSIAANQAEIEDRAAYLRRSYMTRLGLMRRRNSRATTTMTGATR